MVWACGFPIRIPTSAWRSSHARRKRSKSDAGSHDPIGLDCISELDTGELTGFETMPWADLSWRSLWDLLEYDKRYKGCLRIHSWTHQHHQPVLYSLNR